jgi:ABC-2 type transport system ATP-binding protein
MIRVRNLSVHYPLLGVRRGVIADLDGGRLGAQIITKGKRKYAVAIDNLSGDFPEGQVTALVGINGAGKSTLLRALAGILPPTRGVVTVNGKIGAMFTRNLGLDKSATGEENLRLFAALHGLSAAATRRLIEDVSDFSELGPYMKLPLSTYSAGMSARLGFGTVTSLDSDILLIDEMIGAGDLIFQAKAAIRFKSLLKRSSTVIIATHRRDLIDAFCTNALWLDRGRLRLEGPSGMVLDSFQQYVREVLKQREDEVELITDGERG